MRAVAIAASVLIAATACKDRGAPKVSPEQWAEVEATGAAAVAPGPPDELVRALALIDGDRFVDGLHADFDPKDQRLAEEVPEAAIDAVEALIRWDQANGRLPARACVGGTTSLATLKLSRVALLVAGADGDAPEVHAVIALANRYRAEGLSMLEGMVGSAIGDSTRRWAQALALPPTGALRAYAPTEEGLRRIVAAEALCSMSMVAKATDPEQPEAEEFAREYRRHTGRDARALMASETAHLRLYWIDVLAALRARVDDPVTTDRRLAATAERLGRQKLEHPVLSVVVSAMPHTIERLRESDDAQRAWLATAP